MISPGLAAAVFDFGVLIFCVGAFFACCELQSRAAPAIAVVGMLMIVLGGWFS